jgi:hypothetical protein
MDKLFAKNMIKNSLECLKIACLHFINPATTEQYTTQIVQPRPEKIGNDDFFAKLVRDDSEISTSSNQVLST